MSKKRQQSARRRRRANKKAKRHQMVGVANNQPQTGHSQAGMATPGHSPDRLQYDEPVRGGLPGREASEPAEEYSDILAKPEQFVKGADEVYVPLTAANNLPESITLQGHSGTFKQAEVEATNANVVFDGNCGIHYDADAAGRPSTPDSSKVPSDNSVHDRLLHVLRANNARKARPTTQKYNPTTPGVFGEKLYCTHWIRTGECDFMQQGCMYIHCMPDLKTLEDLNFRSYPRWFREMPYDYQQIYAKDFDVQGLNMNQFSRGNSGGGSSVGPVRSYDYDSRSSSAQGHGRKHRRDSPGYRPYGRPSMPPPQQHHQQHPRRNQQRRQQQQHHHQHQLRRHQPGNQLPAHDARYSPYPAGMHIRPPPSPTFSDTIVLAEPIEVGGNTSRRRASVSHPTGRSTSAYSSEENITCISPDIEPVVTFSPGPNNMVVDGANDPPASFTRAELDAKHPAIAPTPYTDRAARQDSGSGSAPPHRGSPAKEGHGLDGASVLSEIKYKHPRRFQSPEFLAEKARLQQEAKAAYKRRMAAEAEEEAAQKKMEEMEEAAKAAKATKEQACNTKADETNGQAAAEDQVLVEDDLMAFE